MAAVFLLTYHEISVSLSQHSAEPGGACSIHDLSKLCGGDQCCFYCIHAGAICGGTSSGDVFLASVSFSGDDLFSGAAANAYLYPDQKEFVDAARGYGDFFYGKRNLCFDRGAESVLSDVGTPFDAGDAVSGGTVSEPAAWLCDSEIRFFKRGVQEIYPLYAGQASQKSGDAGKIPMSKTNIK